MLGYSSPWVPRDVGPWVWDQAEPSQLPPGSCPPADSKYLRQVAEVSVQNGTVGPLEEIQEAVCHKVECIGRGQLRKEFLLLRLIVQDFCFGVAEGKKSRSLRRLHVPYSPS